MLQAQAQRIRRRWRFRHMPPTPFPLHNGTHARHPLTPLLHPNKEKTSRPASNDTSVGILSSRSSPASSPKQLHRDDNAPSPRLGLRSRRLRRGGREALQDSQPQSRRRNWNSVFSRQRRFPAPRIWGRRLRRQHPGCSVQADSRRVVSRAGFGPNGRTQLTLPSHLSPPLTSPSRSKIRFVVNCQDVSSTNFHEGKAGFSYFRWPIAHWWRKFRALREITLTARGMKLTRLLVARARRCAPPHARWTGHRQQLLTNDGVRRYFAPFFTWVDRAIEGGGNVLIHCLAGAHRAGTSGVAYLMHRTKLPAIDAIKLVSFGPREREITLIASGTGLTRLCSNAPIAALLPARVGQAKKCRPIINPIHGLVDVLKLLDAAQHEGGGGGGGGGGGAGGAGGAAAAASS